MTLTAEQAIQAVTQAAEAHWRATGQVPNTVYLSRYVHYLVREWLSSRAGRYLEVRLFPDVPIFSNAALIPDTGPAVERCLLELRPLKNEGSSSMHVVYVTREERQ